MKNIILFAFIFFSVAVHAQKSPLFTVKISQDTVLAGNSLQVVFKLENSKGNRFMPPPFEKFQIVQGPSTQSYYSMVNGEITQSLSFSYWIIPKEEGVIYIEPASIEADNNLLETPLVRVFVMPNPDGIVEERAPVIEEEFFKDLQPVQSKRNRKTTKL
jgi:hypothetical protein